MSFVPKQKSGELICNGSGGSIDRVWELCEKEVPVTRIDTVAAASAALAFVCGNTRRMARDSYIMFKDVYIVIGDDDDPGFKFTLSFHEVGHFLEHGKLPLELDKQEAKYALTSRGLRMLEKNKDALKLAYDKVGEDHWRIVKFLSNKLEKKISWVVHNLIPERGDKIITAQEALRLGVATELF